MTNVSITAIIPAAGIGSRMQQSIPKQYLELQGKPLLTHTLIQLLTFPFVEKCIIAVSPRDPYIEKIIAQFQDKPIRAVDGGETRAESVYAALQHTNPDDWVLVHDAVRPFICHHDIERLIQHRQPQGAILASPAVDTIKQVNAQQQIDKTLDRTLLWHALTPQFFQAKLLKQAYATALLQKVNLTDDASAMEFMGYSPNIVEGRSDNIKITRPEDLLFAEYYLQQRGKNND